MKVYALLLIVFCGTTNISAQQWKIASPDKQVQVTVTLKNQRPVYAITYKQNTVLETSKLGVVREDGDFSTGLLFTGATAVIPVTDQYVMINAKRKKCSYRANKKTFHFNNQAKQPIDIIFQVSNDGVAFRYYFPGKSTDVKRVTRELSSYHFPAESKAWLQPMSVSKSGWEKTNPAYEENYQQAIKTGTPSPTAAGWVYPALFNTGNTWLLLTETAVDSNYCATRLDSSSAGGEYAVAFPSSKESMTGKAVLPESVLPFHTPWRIITIGGLQNIIESTIGTDLAIPARTTQAGFIKPGKASWSWIMSKDDSIVYREQKRYIDFAADMHWQYCLIDVNWDRKIGYDKIKELATYAAQKKVGLILWYNSAGDWNTVRYTPKNKLVNRQSRQQEFQLLHEMGIKGVKIDFFAGDGQSVIQYYHQILQDAAAFQLMVNFHGATLPRGLGRTYPNLLTTEAVKGFEMVTFNQEDANRQANHCAMLPFTRNVFDPMDYTPMNLYKITTQVKRRTTSAFELALSVLFQSGIQHYAESPDGMLHVPDYVKDFLRNLPDQWEDIKFIDGYPGKYIVLARKAGNKWYVAGVNAEPVPRTITLNLAAFGKTEASLIENGADQLSFAKRICKPMATEQIIMKPGDGFVLSF